MANNELVEEQEITEKELVEKKWKRCCNFGHDLAIFKKEKDLLLWNFKKETIHRIFTNI